MKHRVTVVGIIQNSEGHVFLCKKPEGLGIFPGQWSLPGGGIDEGEQMEAALEREIQEETGLMIKDVRPFLFKDDIQEKYYSDGTSEEIYMIYLLFDCRHESGEVKLNEEHEEYAWVKPEDVASYDLNQATRETFEKKGWL